ncbi:condensin-1 complex subunit CAP-D2 isoform X2 [Andrographis paniculata]|uniref:condensin-1 complex subunit CAP-D2 isoform X2 n=1 Tax=Andrographis paniculata TaxID=175694 RepID=UPI0021E7BE5C|nr:condensin-1 complex subunit CAP-D2 isoform X2 [Andrographis paniculata]
MAPSFIFPQTLTSLEEDNDSSYACLTVQNAVSVSSLRPSELEEFVKGVSFDLSDKELFCVEEQEVFDRVYSLVKGFASLSPGCKLNLVESLRSNLSVLLPNVDSLSRSQGSAPQENGSDESFEHGCEQLAADRVASYRNAFKIYTFFLVHIVLIEQSSSTSATNGTKAVASSRKKHPVNLWDWEAQRGRIMNLIANSLEINLSMLFGSSDADENYLSFIMKNAFLMFENALMLKDSATKEALCNIIGTCATKYHYIAQSCASILHLIHRYDFAVTHLADAVAGAEKKYADGSMAAALIREIGRTNPKAYLKDTVGAENIGRFLVELADRLPNLFSTNIGLLIPHFGGESYKIRNALVGVLGKLIAKAFNDVEGEVSSKSIRLRTKQAMLEILLERCRDVSAYTRSRVLQVWAELCEEHSISIGLWNEVATMASGRLEDKSAIVRKSALNLLIMMLQHNPFGPQLRAASFEATLEQYKKKLDELEPKSTPENSEEFPSDSQVSCSDSGVEDEGIKVESKDQDSMTDSCLSQVADEPLQADNSVPDFGNVEQTRALVASLEAGLRFSKCMSDAMPILVQLMASSSSTDVEHTILLLMRCRQFQIDGSEACLRKMLPLVFSQEKSIYEAVENAFIAIYIRKNPVDTAKNLLNLAIDSNIGDLAALEFILGVLVSKGDITASMLSVLWDFFCFNISGTTAQQSRGALSVLCMAAKSSPTVLSSHLQDIIDIGLGQWAKVEPLLARTACLALQRLSVEDKKKLLSTNGNRVFSLLQGLISGFSIPENIWYAAADKAIATLYSIHPTPETIAADLVKRSLKSVFESSEETDMPLEVNSGGSYLLTTVQVRNLSRYLFVVSHVAMNQLAYIESCIHKIQKAKAKKEKMAAENGNVDVNTASNAQKDSGINSELGLAASEDAILDSLAEKAEKEIVSGVGAGKNLIGHCAPFISKLCRNFNLMQKHPDLQASGMLALCRLMIIDAKFCESNLQLLFTVVESAPSEIVRSNCTIALGDLAVRFPNLLEPWTENMYRRLRDQSVSVRKNAVLVLSHLILNDMMKVKGYINEMAMILEDVEERIANLAKLFFYELSKKGNNPVYNLLPDILGKLSSQDLNRESFYNIMQFLIGFIKKDKQVESLVEKLFNRLTGVSDIRLWDYISYCLSLLPFTEKSMRRLMESFKAYEHVLSEDIVMNHFRNIINKGKKFAKPELKSILEEFEEKLNAVHHEKKEQALTEKNAQAHQQKVDNFQNFVATKKVENESGEYDTTEDDETNESIDTQSSKSRRKTTKSRTSSDASSEVTEEEREEEEEGDEDDDEIQSPQRFRRGASKPKVEKSNTKSHNVNSRPSNKRTSRRVKQR